MKKQTYASWDMAGLRARTYVTKKPREPHAPVGDELYAARTDLTCAACGFFECDCDRRRNKFFSGATLTGLCESGHRVLSHPGMTRGGAYVDDRDHAIAMHPDDVEQLRAERAALKNLFNSVARGSASDEADKHINSHLEAATYAFNASGKPRPHPDRNVPLGRVLPGVLDNGEKVISYNPNSTRARDLAYQMCEDKDGRSAYR